MASGNFWASMTLNLMCQWAFCRFTADVFFVDSFPIAFSPTYCVLGLNFWLVIQTDSHYVIPDSGMESIFG